MTRPGESLQIVYMRAGQVRRTSVVAAALNQLLSAAKGRVQLVIARGNSLLPLSMN